MSGARKEAVIGGPGSGKTTYLASRVLERGAIGIDPVGGLRKLLQGHVSILVYDRHGPKEFQVLTDTLGRHFISGKPLLVDSSELTQQESQDFSTDLGHWFRKHFRGGLLVLDEMKWLIPPAPGTSNGMSEFIAKCRNYDVGVVVTGHRPASMNKDVIGLCDTFRVGRMVHPLDLEAATKILRSQASARNLDALAAKLPTLEPGHWYVLQGAAPG